ncbi:MAG: electron transport complex subunit RsxG [bacterium]
MRAWSKQLKSTVKPALLLTMVSLVGGSILAFTQKETEPLIIEQERLATLRSLHSIIPKEIHDSDLLEHQLSIPPDESLKTISNTKVFRAWKDNKPAICVFQINTEDGYSGTIKLLIGIQPNGELSGVRVIAHTETPGLGDAIHQDRSPWILGFTGKSLKQPEDSAWAVKRDGGAFDQFTGATISPRAVVGAVHRTLSYYATHKNTLFQQENTVQINEKAHE